MTEGMPLYDGEGRRKYMTADQRARFLAAAEQAPRETRTFCLTLCYTGCRLSEALAFTADRVDLDAGVVGDPGEPEEVPQWAHGAVPVP